METIAVQMTSEFDLSRMIEVATSRAVKAALAEYEPPQIATAVDEWLSRAKTRAMIDSNYVTMRNLEKQGTLIPRRVGRRVLYRKSDVDAFLESSVRGRSNSYA